MDKEYRNEAVKFNDIANSYKRRRQEILDSGRTDAWIKKELDSLNEMARQKFNDWQQKVNNMAEIYTLAGEDICQDIRRKPAGKELDPATLELHRGLAKDAFMGRDPEDILKSFDRVVGELREDELGAKWIYENTAKSLINDQSFDVAVEETFNKYRTPLEKASYNEAGRRKVFRNHDSTLRGMAEMDLQALMAGEKPVYDDIAQLYDELISEL